MMNRASMAKQITEAPMFSNLKKRTAAGARMGPQPMGQQAVATQKPVPPTMGGRMGLRSGVGPVDPATMAKGRAGFNVKPKPGPAPIEPRISRGPLDKPGPSPKVSRGPGPMYMAKGGSVKAAAQKKCKMC